MEAVPLAKGTGKGLNNHVTNFLECIDSRNPNTNASVEIGAHIAKFSQLEILLIVPGKNLSGTERNLPMILRQIIILYQITGNHGFCLRLV